MPNYLSDIMYKGLVSRGIDVTALQNAIASYFQMFPIDLSGLQPKETGKGLSTNDYTSEEKQKLAGISEVGGGMTQSQILKRQL